MVSMFMFSYEKEPDHQKEAVTFLPLPAFQNKPVAYACLATTLLLFALNFFLVFKTHNYIVSGVILFFALIVFLPFYVASLQTKTFQYSVSFLGIGLTNGCFSEFRKRLLNARLLNASISERSKLEEIRNELNWEEIITWDEMISVSHKPGKSFWIPERLHIKTKGEKALNMQDMFILHLNITEQERNELEKIVLENAPENNPLRTWVEADLNPLEPKKLENRIIRRS